MNQMRRVPPAMEAEIKRRLATGESLPPGVKIAGPPGSGFPQGMPQNPGVPTKESMNPLPDGPEGLQMLRQLQECPIPQESQTISQHIQKLAVAENTEKKGKIEEVMARGLVTAMRANYYCKENLKERVVVYFNKDDKLKALNEEFKAVEARVDDLQKEMQDLATKGKALLQERWDKAVKTYGLSPEKFFYWIKEEEGTIIQVDLKCPECKGSTIVRKARQETGELIAKLNAPLAPVKDPEPKE